MAQDVPRKPAPARNVPRTELRIGGKPYVLIRRSDFDQLCDRAEGPHEDATRFGSGTVGPDLRSRRIEARLTLTEVARRAGIRLETLSRIEHGHTEPSIRTVRSILRALGEIEPHSRRTS